MEDLQDLAVFTVIKGMKLGPEPNFADEVQSQQNMEDAEINSRRRECGLVEDANEFLVKKEYWQPGATENDETNRDVFFEFTVLCVDGGWLKSWCEALALLSPPFLVHLSEESVATERLETIVLLWGLLPVLVRDLGDQFRVPDVDDAGEQAVPLRSSA